MPFSFLPFRNCPSSFFKGKRLFLLTLTIYSIANTLSVANANQELKGSYR